MLRHYMRDRGLVMGQVDRTQENSKDLVKPRVRIVKVVNKIRGPSHLRDTRTTSGTNRAPERRPVQSKQATTVRPCPYYLHSRIKQPEGIPEDRRSIGIDSITQNNIRRRSLSMKALDGDPVDRSG
ncbi:uncharacterized protein TNCV_2892191 [Trichonephila clavipes]|nr:uncharacterized protein TNCV_2892191 [Trichonephila clavipes]